MDVGRNMGLNINVSKSELIAHPHLTVMLLLSFQQIPSENAELLGAPRFSGIALDLTWAKRCDELTNAQPLTGLLLSVHRMLLLF